MNIVRFARCWLIKREIDRGVRRQRIAREERAKAALRGMRRA